jgi:hypothetical protein
MSFLAGLVFIGVSRRSPGSYYLYLISMRPLIGLNAVVSSSSTLALAFYRSLTTCGIAKAIGLVAFIAVHVIIV